MVTEITELRTLEGYSNPEEERMDLSRMDEEAEELVMLAQTLVQKAQDGYRVTRRETPGAESGDEGVVPVITVEHVLPKGKEQEEVSMNILNSE